MGMVIGIDVGGSTTKIIGVDKEGIKHPMIVKAEDPITSLFGAFGKYIYDNGISLNDIDKVMLTGVGSAYVNQPLYGLSTDHTDEFLANGLGAHYDSQLQDLIVVSMGTGTSFVKVEGGKNISHIGGIGIGGGTIQGLSRLLLKTQNIHQVVKMAEKGVIENITSHIWKIFCGCHGNHFTGVMAVCRIVAAQLQVYVCQFACACDSNHCCACNRQ